MQQIHKTGPLLSVAPPFLTDVSPTVMLIQIQDAHGG